MVVDLSDPRSSIVKPEKAIEELSKLNIGKVENKNVRDNTIEDMAKLNIGKVRKFVGR